MSFLSRLFGSGPASGGPNDVESELARIEAEAENARPGYVGTSFNKAGDLALRSGEEDRAVGYYGRAIDAFLDDRQREAARGVANKIIRVRPTAVRTLCTLTWLDLAAQHQATALLHLRDYVESAKEADQHTRAAAQIYAMAKLSTDREFIDAVADALDGLAFSARAREVRSWAADGAPNAVADPEELALVCLRGAVNSSVSDTSLVRDDEDGGATDEVHAADDTGERAGDGGGDEREAIVVSDEPEGSATGASETSRKHSAKKSRKTKEKKRYRWE